MKTINNFIKIIIFLVVLNGGILLITYVLTPKIPSFYWEKHYDAVFFGTSQSYCSFDPLIFGIWGSGYSETNFIYFQF